MKIVRFQTGFANTTHNPSAIGQTDSPDNFVVIVAKFPNFNLVAVDSLGVQVVVGGHLVQVGQTFP